MNFSFSGPELLGKVGLAWSYLILLVFAVLTFVLCCYLVLKPLFDPPEYKCLRSPLDEWKYWISTDDHAFKFPKENPTHILVKNASLHCMIDDAEFNDKVNLFQNSRSNFSAKMVSFNVGLLTVCCLILLCYENL